MRKVSIVLIGLLPGVAFASDFSGLLSLMLGLTGLLFAIPYGLYVVIRSIFYKFETEAQANSHKFIAWVYAGVSSLVTLFDMPSGASDQIFFLLFITGYIVYAWVLSILISINYEKNQL